MKIPRFLLSTLVGSLLAPAAIAISQPDGLWQLDGSLDNSVGTASLSQTGFDLIFRERLIGEEVATVLDLPALQADDLLTITHAVGGNGGGTYTNEWTLMMDVCFNGGLAPAQSLIQTNVPNTNNVDASFNSAGAFFADGSRVGPNNRIVDSGSGRPRRWYRLTIQAEVEFGEQYVSYYIDGHYIQSRALLPLDGRLSLDSVFHIFTDNNGDTQDAEINSIAFWGEVVHFSDVAALGGPEAGGVQILPTPNLVTKATNTGTGSLRSVVAAAPSGSTITFAENLAGKTIPLSSEIVINKDLFIDASRLAAPFEIDGGGSGRLFSVTSVGSLTLRSLVLRDGSAGDGGAIHNASDRLVLSDVVITNCNASGRGGAIYNDGSSAKTFLGNCTVSDNTAGDDGGGIFNLGGEVACISSLIVRNTASGDDGGGFYSSGGTLVFQHSTLTENSAGDKGGGFLANGGAAVVCNSSTISGNTAGANGGGIRLGSSTSVLILSDSIVAANTGGSTAPDISNNGANVLGSENLIGDNTSVATEFPTALPLVGTAGNLADPGLGALGDYGGPTQVMPLLASSPAIDAASNTYTRDQRGASRPVDGDGNGSALRDIGAFEYRTSQVSNTNDSGPGSLREAVEVAVPGSVITFAPSMDGKTINLTSAALVIDRPLAISAFSLGQGITISGGNSRRVFWIKDGATDVVMRRLRIIDGQATSSVSGHGGGVYLDAARLKMFDCTISGCQAADGSPFGFDGGAIYNNGDLELLRCTLDNNSSGSGSSFNGYGGAIYNPGEFGYGRLRLTGCTLHGNSSGCQGGALFMSGGDARLVSCTIASNMASDNGGGIFLANNTETLHLENSILADNSTGGSSPDLHGDLTSHGGVNWIGDPPGAGGLGALASEYFTGNPMLGSLAANGGFVQTIKPQAGSPVLNLGVVTAESPQTDGRNYFRSSGGALDIGAFEEGANPNLPFTSDGLGWRVTGRIEAEDFDYGGYSDLESRNNGGAYRGDGVDIQATADVGGGFNIGWIRVGEYTEYTVDIPVDGDYTLVFRVAQNAATFRLEFDGIDKTGPISFTGTGGSQTWKDVVIPDVPLDAGRQTMRISWLATTGCNLNYIDILHQHPMRSLEFDNASGDVTMSWDAYAGGDYEIECSYDMINWGSIVVPFSNHGAYSSATWDTPSKLGIIPKRLFVRPKEVW